MVCKLVKILIFVIILFMVDVCLASAPVIIPEIPLNETYFRNDMDWNFTSYDDSNASYSVWGYQDDMLLYEANFFTNNTHEKIANAFLSNSIGTHNITVLAKDNADTTTNEIFYTIKHYELQVDYDQNVMETSTHDYNITIPYDSTKIDNVTSNLIYNGTNYTTETFLSNSTHFIFNRTLQTPLVQENNTQKTFYFYNEIGYVNGSVLYDNSTTYTQNITIGFWIDSFSSDSANYLEGEDSTITLTVVDILGNANISANFTMIYNGTYNETYQVLSYDIIGDAYSYEKVFDVGISVNNSETRTIYGNFTVQFGNDTKTLGEQDTLDVYKAIIIECGSISNTTTLSINFYDESTFDIKNASIDVLLFTVTSGNIVEEYSFFNITENETYSYCIYPTWAELNTTVYLEYVSTDSPKRPYYLVDTELTSTLSSLNAYLLNNTHAEYTNIYLYDQNSYKLDGYYVRILKYDPSVGAWINLFIGKTDNSGIFPTYLETLIQPYTFYITDGSGSIVYRTNPEVIPCLSGDCPPYEKHIYTEPLETDYINLLGVETNYDFDESTRTLIIEISDTTGLVDSIWLKINGLLDFNTTTSYLNQTYDSSTLYYTTVLPNTTSEYTVNVYVEEYGSYYPLITESITMETVKALGNTGVILSFLLILTIVIAGLYVGKTVGGLIGGAGGLYLCYVFRLIPIPIIGLYSVLLVIVILVVNIMGDN